MMFESIQACVGEGIEIFRGAVELFLSNVILLVVNAHFDAQASALAASLILICVFQESLHENRLWDRLYCAKILLRAQVVILAKNPQPFCVLPVLYVYRPQSIASPSCVSVFCNPSSGKFSFRCPNRVPIHLE